MKKSSNTQQCVLWNSQSWIMYFNRNASNTVNLTADCHLISEAERNQIEKSIAVFQLGESSDGRRLLQTARIYAANSGDAHLPGAVALFIAEEQRHAAMLAEFMQQQRIRQLRKNWTDNVFRFLRRAWNFEVCMRVLMTAELVARVYYRALSSATSSQTLKRICTRLLQDEARHIAFHSGLLRRMHQSQSTLRKITTDLLYIIFHCVTLLVVWLGHHKVFRAGGFPFPRYWRVSRSYLFHAKSLIEIPLQNEAAEMQQKTVA